MSDQVKSVDNTSPNSTQVNVGDSLPPMPEGGNEKYYDAKTGAYNWEAHAREVEFKAAQRASKAVETPQQAQTAEQSVEQAGLDYDVLSQKIATYGDISPEDYAALTKVGVPRELVEAHVEYVKNDLAQHYSAVVETFGGEQGFQQMAAWAKENLSEEERSAFTDMLNNPKQYKAAAATLRGMMGQTYSAPNAAAPSGTVQGYATEADMLAAMTGANRSKYMNDPEYRREVHSKVAASKFNTNPRSHTSGL